jgi:short subunit dehydrogenase-like uncharacterized protein
MGERTYDLVVYGATSFVGQILTRYLWQELNLGKVRWAIAGRSAGKLQELKASLGSEAAGLPVISADSTDENSLRSLCASARVVISTVGPYALYGEPLVKACVEAGTDYCDLTGEVQWIRRMIRRYESAAQKSGARIVHCCGFDSIPSDLGVHFLQRAAQERLGTVCKRVKMRVKVMKGGFSGGTVASILNVFKEVSADPALRKELGDPYSLYPEGKAPSMRQPDVTSATYDADFDTWLAPFLMAGINTRIVHRTNALSALAYGADFAYDEAVITGRGLKGRLAASTATVGAGAFMVASALSPTRALLERFVLPKPGEGPSPEAQRTGYFDLRFLGIAADGRKIKVKVTGDRDPGYGSTAKMLGEAAQCLAFDVDRTSGGGFYTPATLLGDKLIQRLKARAGLTFESVTE